MHFNARRFWLTSSYADVQARLLSLRAARARNLERWEEAARLGRGAYESFMRLGEASEAVWEPCYIAISAFQADPFDAAEAAAREALTDVRRLHVQNARAANRDPPLRASIGAMPVRRI